MAVIEFDPHMEIMDGFLENMDEVIQVRDQGDDVLSPN